MVDAVHRDLLGHRRVDLALRRLVFRGHLVGAFRVGPIGEGQLRQALVSLDVAGPGVGRHLPEAEAEESQDLRSQPDSGPVNQLRTICLSKDGCTCPGT